MADKSKLEWVYQDHSDSQVAYVERDGTKYRIRAVRDETPTCPFDDWDGHWPMLVLTTDARGTFGRYECPTNSGVAISTPFNGAALSSCRTPDALLVHDQHAFAKALGFDTPAALVECHGLSEDAVDASDRPVRYFRDAGVLREAMHEAMGDMDDSGRLDALERIYGVLGIPCLNTTVTGYSQGDSAHLLIVGVPEKEREFQGETVRSPDQIMADLKSQAELYRAWAFGDVYGYVIEKLTSVCAEFDEGSEWEEIEDGSCWGYYGSDHSASGLEDAALECLPAEQVPA